MSQFQAELLRIIVRASSPFERGTGEWFDPSGDKLEETVNRRAAQWMQAISPWSTDTFREYLKTRGLHNGSFERSISDGVVKEESKLPEWAKVFLALMEKCRILSEEYSLSDRFADVKSGSPFRELLLPFLKIAVDQLRKKFATLEFAIAERAEARILDVLSSRLSHAVIHVVDNEMQTAFAASDLMKQLGIAPSQRQDGSLAGWMSRFDRYPVLARLVSVVFMNWRAYVFEMLERLDGDKSLLEDKLFGGRPIGTLEDMIGDAGDLHDQGRAVALLIFDGDKRVAYKPKDLRISAAFLELVSFLNSNGLEMPLHVRQIITRGDYAWEEWVSHHECSSATEVQRFYFRMGMLIRLLQFLGARDFWLDNLIACGDQPVFIDLEMAFQQKMATPAQLTPAESLAFEKMVETVVPMGTVSMVTPVGLGIKADDLGALTPVREFQTPFKFSYSSPMRDLIAPHLKKNDNAKWHKTDYTPILNGKPAVAAEHLEDVIAGYESMNACLCSNKETLLQAGGPLQGIGDFPLRHITRDTWSCLRIINDSTRTALLVDGFQRELFFEGLMRIAVDAGMPNGQQISVVRSEIDSLRDLDVPLSRGIPSNLVLQTSNGKSVADYFSGASLALINERLEKLDDFPVAEHSDFIRSSFAVGPHKVPGMPVAIRRADGIEKNREFWLDQAIKLADYVLEQGIRSAEGDMAWLGLIYHPDIDMRAVDVLRPDLLSGTCGLAVVFDDLYESTGIDRFKEAAIGALSGSTLSIKDHHPLIRMMDPNGPTKSRLVAAGAYYGVGGQIYALRRCANGLKDAELQETVAAYLRMLVVPELCERSHVDLISGLAGMLLALLPFKGETPAGLALSLPTQITEYLLNFCLEKAAGLKSPYPKDAELLAGLPDTWTGFRLAFARVEKTIGASLPATIREKIASVIRMLESLKGPQIPSTPCLWAELSISQISGLNSGDLIKDAKQQIASDISQASSLRLIEILETSLTAFRSSGDEQFYSWAVCAADQFVARREGTGSWFPDSFAADRHNLSAMHGIAAIAHYFTYLSNPERFRSMRGIE